MAYIGVLPILVTLGTQTVFDGISLNITRGSGISGFPKRGENPCDAFNTGHSSTSISAGIGMAQARDLLDQLNSSERIVYPGLDGLSRWLARHYYVKPDDA